MRKKSKGSVAASLSSAVPVGDEVTSRGQGAFRKLVEDKKRCVIERLQLGGDFPQCNKENATSQDWQHILSEANTDLFEYLRFDENDPEVAKVIVKRLALIAAIVEEWAENFDGE
jgi:hypothetical protein